MIRGLHTVLVQTTDMARSQAFYRDVLGLAPGHQSPYWSDFALGELRLGIHPVWHGNPDPPVVEFKNAVLGVEVDDISELRRTLLAAGDYVRGEYHDTPGGVILNFVDPDGNNWQAIQPGRSARDLG